MVENVWNGVVLGRNRHLFGHDFCVIEIGFQCELTDFYFSVSYISKEDAAAYQETAANQPPTPPHPSMMPSPK